MNLKELSLNILAGICTDQRDNQKQFRRHHGIELLVQLMQYTDVDKSGNSITFLVAVLDCISSCVYGNKRSEIHFLDIDGVQNLLNLVETSDYTLKRLALSSLCTILENTKSFKHFIEWNSKQSSVNATQMLISLYAKEDVRFGVLVEDGILKNNERPLFPRVSYLKQKYDSDPRMEAEYAKTHISVQEPADTDNNGEGNNQNRSETPSRSKASRVLRLALDHAKSIQNKDR